MEAEQKMYANFRRLRGLGYMTVSEMLETMQTMHKNDLFDTFPEFSEVAHILAVIPAHIVFSRAIIQRVAAIENLPPQHHGAKINVFVQRRK